jgi:hypothetical protein
VDPELGLQANVRRTDGGDEERLLQDKAIALSRTNATPPAKNPQVPLPHEHLIPSQPPTPQPGRYTMQVQAIRSFFQMLTFAERKAIAREREHDMIFNDYRMKERESEFRPDFKRHRNPDFDRDEFFPLHALIESNSHNPIW